MCHWNRLPSFHKFMCNDKKLFANIRLHMSKYVVKISNSYQKLLMLFLEYYEIFSRFKVLPKLLPSI